MYGTFGTLTAEPGRRADLVAVMTQAAAMVGELPGCHLYVVSEDLEDDDRIRVFEVWDDEEAHDRALADERVRALIAGARPLLAGRPEGIKLHVVGGHGLTRR